MRNTIYRLGPPQIKGPDDFGYSAATVLADMLHATVNTWLKRHGPGSSPIEPVQNVTVEFAEVNAEKKRSLPLKEVAGSRLMQFKARYKGKRVFYACALISTEGNKYHTIYFRYGPWVKLLDEYCRYALEEMDLEVAEDLAKLFDELGGRDA